MGWLGLAGEVEFTPNGDEACSCFRQGSGATLCASLALTCGQLCGQLENETLFSQARWPKCVWKQFFKIPLGYDLGI
jgi:hypothetical protein